MNRALTHIPNTITFSRLVLIFPILWFLESEMNLAAISLFWVAVYTDYLDGYVARRLNQETSSGAFWDAAVDKIFVYTFFLYLVSIAAVDSWVVMIAFARDLYVTVLRVVSNRLGFSLKANMYGKMKFCFQIAAIFSAIALGSFPGESAANWLFFPTGFLLIAILASIPGVPLLTRQFLAFVLTKNRTCKQPD